MSALDDGIARALRLGCPTALASVIRNFVNAARECFENQKVGVLLVGSASRGELSWRRIGDEVELFSDVEFVVGVEHKSPAQQQQIDKRVQEISRRADLGKLFHIDYTLIEWSNLPKLDTKFFVFESKACGIDLCTDKVSQYLPTTTLENLNRKELNEILVHRLSSIVHAIPPDIFEPNMAAGLRQRLALTVAKNTLDVTTWLHPYESDSLVSGYTKRLSTWQGSDFGTLTLSRYFGDEEVRYLEYCLALRNTPSTSVDPRQMLRKSLDLYLKAIRYSKHMNGIGEAIPISDARPSAILFDEYRLRPRVAQAESILRHWRQTGFGRLFKNVLGIRRGLAARICIDLLSAVVRSEADQRNADRALESARCMLNSVIRVPVSARSDFPSRWIATLDTFSKYQQITRNF